MKMKGRLMLLVMLVVAIALGAVSYYGIGEDGQMSAAQIWQNFSAKKYSTKPLLCIPKIYFSKRKTF